MNCAQDLADPTGVASRIRTVVLLAGGLGRRTQSPGNGRGILALPITPERDALDVWLDTLGRFAEELRDDASLDVRIAIDQRTRAPQTAGRGFSDRLSVSIAHDDAEYRGTAGTLRDATVDLLPEDLVLVVVASQLPIQSMSDALTTLDDGDEGVLLSRSGRSDLVSLFLLRRQRLESVPTVGFFDLKEQFRVSRPADSPIIAARLPDGAFMPIRTRREYIDTLHTLHTLHAGRVKQHAVSAWDSFGERWQSSFQLAAPGSTVHATALIQDSVVCDGATVEASAHVVRSVVCAGGVVGAGSVVVDSVVTASGTHAV